MKKVFLIIWMLTLSVISYAQTFTVGTINYEVTSTSPANVSVVNSPSASGDVVIPATVDNSGTTYAVTSIGPSAFEENSLNSVVIPTGVTTIGGSAFHRSFLKSVTLPVGVTSIGDLAFRANSFTSIIIPDGVITIGASAFALCELVDITIPASVTSIGNDAFASNNIASITAESATPITIDASVFGGATLANLTLTVPAGAVAAYQAAAVWKDFGSIVPPPPAVGDLFTVGTINYAITSISPAAVEVKDSPSATGDLVIPATVDNNSNTYTVTGVGDNAFNENQLTSVSIPTSVTSIGFGAFQDNQLTSITIPSGVTSIESHVFAKNKLTSVSIPNSVTSIGNEAFQDNLLTNVSIPPGVTSIGDFAFQVNRLTSVSIPVGVTTIDDSAFAFNSLTSVSIPSSVTTIESAAFDGNNLTDISIPASVTSIEIRAFAGNQLTSFTVENPTPLTIDANVFESSDLTKATLNVPAGAKAAYQAADIWKTFGTIVASPGVGDLFTVGTINYAITSTSPATVEVKDSPSATGDLVIPATVDNNGTSYAVTSIDGFAFEKNQLTSIVIPVGVISIGTDAFEGNQLTTVIIPDGVTTIGNLAFQANDLTSVTIPSSVTSIGNSAFGLNSLTSVTIPAGVTTIESRTFDGNRLTSITMPGVTSIGEGAFANNALTTFVIPSGVVSMEDNVFAGNELTSITIPTSVTSIGDGVFERNQLTSVTVENPTPLAINASVFTGVTLANLTLNVPAGAKAAYQAADVWKTFGTISAPTGVGDLFTVGTINYAITSISPATVEIKDSPSATGDLVIPATVDNNGTTYNVTSIGDNAFDNNNLDSVVIPIGVITIGNNAFSNNTLHRQIIPAGVTSIGNSAFENSNLQSIKIPASVSSIGNKAFKVQNLLNVTVEHTTPLAIDASIFDSDELGRFTLNVPVNSLSAYKAASVWKDFSSFLFTINSVNYGITPSKPTEVAVGESHYTVGDVVFPTMVENEGTTYTVISIGEHAFSQNKALTSVIIPEGVTSMGSFAFSNNLLTSATIPSSVTYIGNQAFEGNQLTNVIIPDGVTHIGLSTFASNKLTSVTIPSSVTSIDGEAFNNNQLASISIPASVTDIGSSAFAMNLLTSVSIPDGVTSISEDTFRNNKLTSISLPSSVTSIGRSAFANNSLTSYSIPAGVTSIGDWAFENNELTSITIPTSVTSIGEGPFNQNQLTSVTLENPTPLVIDANVFAGVTLANLTLNVPSGTVAAYQAADVWKTFGTIVAPPGVGDLFTVGTINYAVTSLSPATVEVKDSPSATGDLVIPETVDDKGITYTVTVIGPFAFSENNLTSVSIPGSIIRLREHAFSHNQLTSVTIPASVANMGHDAFSSNQLTSVSIPVGVTEIDGYAFGSNMLTSVSIPNSVTNIGLGAFYDNQLASVNIPASVTNISPEAFSTNKLTAITIPASVTSISIQAFAFNQLTSVTVENPTPVAIEASVFEGSTLANLALNVPTGALAAYQAAAVWKDFGTIKLIVPVVGDLFTVGTINYAITSISPATVEVKDSPSATGTAVIPATVDNRGNTYNVTSIGEAAFEGNQLTSITIPVGVTNIGSLAFSNNQLTSISIPEGVTSIGDNAFERNQLPNVNIPTGVTSIGDNAFGLNFLVSVSIPASVTSIGSGAFSMNSLTSVSIPAGVTSIGSGAFDSNQLTSISIPASVTSIEDDTFRGNEITSITMPGVTSIGASAFSNNKLTNFSIPAGVTSIGNSAFESNELTSVTISASVTSIGNDAFGSNQLTSVTVEHTTPLAIDVSVFSGATLANLTLNVPAGTVAAYQAAVIWKDFGTIETPIAVGDLFTVGTINYVITSISPATVETKDSPSATGSVVIPATVDDSGMTYSVTGIGSFSFESNEITSVSIPVGVTTISSSAFDSNQLTGISIPESVTSIGERAFALNNLTTVTIPASVTSIGDNVFNGNQLTNVTVVNTTPLEIGTNVFSGTTLADLILSVPSGTVEAYQSAVVWMDFGHIGEVDVNIVNASAEAGTLTQAELTTAGITQTGLTTDQIAVITIKVASANPAPGTTADLQAIVDAAIAEENAVNVAVASANASTLTEAELTAAGISQTGLSADQIAIITTRIVAASPVPNTTADLQTIVDAAIGEEAAVNAVVASANAGTLVEAELTTAGVTQTDINADQIAVITIKIVAADPIPNTTVDLQAIVDAAIAEEAAVNAAVASAAAGTLTEAELTAAGVTQTGLNAGQIVVITTNIVSADPVPNTSSDLQTIVDDAIAEESAVNAAVASAIADTLTEEELIAAGITQTDLNTDQISIITIKIASANPAPNTTAELQTIVDDAIAEESAVNTVVASSIADTLTEEELIAAGISQTDLTTDQVIVISLEVFLADPEPNTTAELQVIVDAAIAQENAVNIVVASAIAGTLTQEELTAAGVTQTDLTEEELAVISEEILFVDPAPNTTFELQDIVDFALSVISSVDDKVNNENQISVYPNPTRGAINIESTDDVLSIEIYNMQGVLISTTPDLSHADNGIYLIRVTSKKGMQTKRIIKN